MKEVLRRETYRTAVGGDRGADRPACLPWGLGRTRASRCLSWPGSGPRLIIQRAVEDEFDAWLGRARYERRPGISAGCATTTRASQRLSPAPGAGARGRARGGDPAGPRGGRAVRLEAVSVQHEGAAHRAAAGDGDRRVRQGAVDARHQVAVRAGGARQALQGDRLADLRRASGRFERSSAATSTTSRWRRCSWTPSFSRSARTGPRRACWWPGDLPNRASACCLKVMLGMRESHEDWLALGGT